MIDLSNNNGTGHNYGRAYQSGHRRVYFKATEGTTFIDKVFHREGAAANRAGFRVGAYHFAHGVASPAEEFGLFLSSLHGLAFKLRLRPALDLEIGHAGKALGRWAQDWIRLCRRELGCDPIVYSYGSFLQACHFTAPVPGLWLASYGRNDGKEHPYVVPRPWAQVAAHQFTSNAAVPGIRGRCDVSHVYDATAVDRPNR